MIVKPGKNDIINSFETLCLVFIMVSFVVA